MTLGDAGRGAGMGEGDTAKGACGIGPVAAVGPEASFCSESSGSRIEHTPQLSHLRDWGAGVFAPQPLPAAIRTLLVSLALRPTVQVAEGLQVKRVSSGHGMRWWRLAFQPVSAGRGLVGETVWAGLS